jgi:hypothetical protein
MIQIAQAVTVVQAAAVPVSHTLEDHQEAVPLVRALLAAQASQAVAAEAAAELVKLETPMEMAQAATVRPALLPEYRSHMRAEAAVVSETLPEALLLQADWVEAEQVVTLTLPIPLELQTPAAVVVVDVETFHADLRG